LQPAFEAFLIWLNLLRRYLYNANRERYVDSWFRDENCFDFRATPAKMLPNPATPHNPRKPVHLRRMQRDKFRIWVNIYLAYNNRPEPKAP